MVSFIISNTSTDFLLVSIGQDDTVAICRVYSPITINGTKWDGNSAVNFTDTINSMIDTKTDALTAADVGALPDTTDTLPNPNALTINGQTYDGSSEVTVETAKKKQAVYYIEGTSTTAGTWLGSHDDITEYYSGLMVAYKVNIAGDSGLTLNINNLGAVPVVRNTSSAVTTHYGVDSIIFLIYTVDSSGTTYWKIADYDSDTKTRSSNKTATKMYLIGAQSQSTSGQTTYSNSNCYIGTDNCLYSGGNKVATESSIPTTLKNPEVLTINGEVYDGSEAKDMTEAIRNISCLPTVSSDNNGSFLRVVDGKWAISTITNAEEVSF